MRMPVTDTDDLPTRARFVEYALAHHEPCTRAELEQITGLNERTVQRALRQLCDRGRVEREAHPHPRMKPQYSVVRQD